MATKPKANAPQRATVPAGRRKATGDFMVVGIGASAGGIDALQDLFKQIPADTGMGFVVLLHLDPKHESSLPQIISRCTPMPVKTIGNKEPVLPNHVYVLPPNREVTIQKRILSLATRKKSDGQYLVIDHFFSSLAEDLGNGAVAVILSGNGTDGTLGAKQVKSEGGVTFAQDDKTASFHGMPMSAVHGGAIDFILPPEQIARELVRISSHAGLRRRGAAPDPSLTIAEAELAKVFSLLRALHGVDFSYYKHSTLRRRITRRMILRKVDTLREYVAFLQQNPNEVDGLFQDLLINVTAFFRDPLAFQALRKKVFPRLLKNQQGNSPIRIWVPGCSTGEEVYSLAIALFEFLGKDAHSKPVQIFGTDVSEAVLAKARAGIYPESIASHIPADRLRRYFHKTDSGYQIAKFVRDCCVFARQNVVEDPPFSKIDLISCRNVLIYLGPLLQKKVMPIFHYALKKHGVMILGGSETIGVFSDLFTLTDKKNKIYFRRDGHTRPDVAFVPTRTAPTLEDVPPPKPALPEDLGTLDLQKHVDRIVLAQYAPAGVVINSSMEVLQFRGQTSPYLEHSPGEASLNLMKMVRQELLVDLRTAISRVMKMDTVIRKDSISFHTHGKHRAVNLEVIPFRSGPSNERFFIILFEDVPVSERPVAKTSKKTGGARSVEAEREMSRMREELSSTKESLQAIIEEQEATNEELKSANEEIQSSNEELQSTNEELETAKEELQSTNEELTTLNEELQNRNTELSQLNNDLSNLLSSVSMPILMLGNDLTIRRFTPLAERFFNLIPSDVGRRITDINPNVLIPSLEKLVSEVIETLRIQEQEVQDREGRWYSLRIRPYRTTENKIDGAVVMLVDIDEMKRALEEFTSVIRQPVLTLSGDLIVTRANPAFFAAFNCGPENTQGLSVYELCNRAFNVPAMRSLLEGVLPEKGRIDQFRVDAALQGLGHRALDVSARRFYHPSKGTQVTLLAFEIASPEQVGKNAAAKAK